MIFATLFKSFIELPCLIKTGSSQSQSTNQFILKIRSELARLQQLDNEYKETLKNCFLALNLVISEAKINVLYNYDCIYIQKISFCSSIYY